MRKDAVCAFGTFACRMEPARFIVVIFALGTIFTLAFEVKLAQLLDICDYWSCFWTRGTAFSVSGLSFGFAFG